MQQATVTPSDSETVTKCIDGDISSSHVRTLAPAARAAAGAASWSSDSSDSLGSGAHGGASGGTATVRSTANPIPRPELAP